MKTPSPPLSILFFAARDLQREYFTSLSHHLYCTSKVVWYKQLFIPGVNGFKYLSKANLGLIIDYKLREKRNTLIADDKSIKNNEIYWKLYAYVRRISANLIFLIYVNYLQRNPSEYIAVWNGNKLRQAIMVQAAKSLGRKCVFFENGLLPNTTTMDFQGVNAFNSLPRNREFYEKLKFDKDVELPSKLVTRLPEVEKENYSATESLPQNFIFVPFQVNSDSQITIHSPWIRNMEHLFDVISDILSQIHNKEICFVFKEHPSSGQDYIYLHQRAQNEERLVFANDFDTQELIEKSLAVITINSTVGLEALLLKKRVVVLGDAFYGIDDLSKSVKTEPELAAVINGLSEWEVDEKLRGNFLRYLQNDYAIPENWNSPADGHWARINERFGCKQNLATRVLFMVSTPLNLFMASVVALSLKGSDKEKKHFELCFIDQHEQSGRVYLDAVNEWGSTPFDVIHILPPRTKGTIKKLQNRRQSFQQIKKIVDDLKPDVLAVGNDRRVEFQFAMFYSEQAGHYPRGAYLDDGTFTYVGRKDRGVQDSLIDNAVKKLVYGSWWKQPKSVGASEWIDDAYVAFPDLVHETLQKKHLHKIDANQFESDSVKSLSKNLLNKFDIDNETLDRFDVILTLPHASLIGDQSMYAGVMRRIVKGLSARGKQIGIKYHPRQEGTDPLGLAGEKGVMLIPAPLAFEVLLPVLGDAIIVGDVSTTLLSSKWLRPTLRTIAISRSTYGKQFLNLFHALGIEVIDSVTQLADKLKD